MIERTRMATILKETKKIEVEKTVTKQAKKARIAEQQAEEIAAKKSKRAKIVSESETSRSEEPVTSTVNTAPKKCAESTLVSTNTNKTSPPAQTITAREPPSQEPVAPRTPSTNSQLAHSTPTSRVNASLNRTPLVIENENSSSSANTSYVDTGLDHNENDMPASPAIVIIDTTSTGSSLPSASSTNKSTGGYENALRISNATNLFIGNQLGNAFQWCNNSTGNNNSTPSTPASQSFSATAPNTQTFVYQPQIAHLQQQLMQMQHQQQSQLRQQSPLILPKNFNGTILYQPTIYLNTNKKLSDLINMQKSLEKYRQIVPKPSPGNASSANLSSKKNAPNNK